jgi:hypothetical protein
MGKKVIFSEEQINNIITRYKDGESCAKIGQDYDVKQQTINRLLHQNNVIVSNRKHNFNEDYFKKIDTAEKAYWLGFIAADGYVHEKRGFMRIKLQECDKDHLIKFVQTIDGDMNMIKYEYHNLTGNKQYYVEVNSRKFIDNLINLNIRQGKSSGKEQLTPIPKRYIRDYIRGLWDGDGHIEEKRLDLISSIEVLEFVQKYLNEKCKTNINKILGHCNTYRIYVCATRYKVLNHLYYKDCISLNRKYNLAIHLVKEYKKKTAV